MASQATNRTRALGATSTPSTANTVYVVSALVGGAGASALAGPAFTAWG